MSQSFKKLLGLFTVIIIMLFSLTPTFQTVVNFPKEIRMFKSAEKHFDLKVPISATVSSTNNDIIEFNERNPLTLKPKNEGKSILKLKFFGVIPFRSVKVNVMKDIKVIPGGQTIGVKLKSAGIMVVGHHSIKQENGIVISPAEKAGIRVGDLILKINGQSVTGVNDVVNNINQLAKKKEKIQMEILRNNERLKINIEPGFDIEEKVYRLGIYIRDSAAGVGTLTFYDPISHNYGALGHVITDIDTQKPIIVKEGEILYSNVTSIDKGESGKPGGKRAIIVDEANVIGDITKNTPFGIFGKMKGKPANGLLNSPIPIALPEEVKEGPAEILTVIEGQKVEKFKIEIVNIVPQKYPATKGMIIKVTDPKLLEKTGGIVQGMSGSPIIQDGKLVGAVTHVFVNEPTSGYGSFIEWMIRDAELLDNNEHINNNLKAS